LKLIIYSKPKKKLKTQSREFFVKINNVFVSVFIMILYFYHIFDNFRMQIKYLLTRLQVKHCTELKSFPSNISEIMLLYLTWSFLFFWHNASLFPWFILANRWRSSFLVKFIRSDVSSDKELRSLTPESQVSYSSTPSELLSAFVKDLSSSLSEHSSLSSSGRAKWLCSTLCFLEVPG